MLGGEQRFISGIAEIGGILSRLEPATSPLLQAVDVKGQDYSTYYFAAFSDTRDMERSLTVYRYVRDFIRVIVLMDRYYEVGNERYRRLGRAIISRLNKDDDEFLRNVVNYELKQFWPFWKFEQHAKKRMMHGCVFSLNEIESFNLFKSSDAALIYARVLEGTLPDFNRNAALVLHYNQALQDIADDFDDIQEDLQDQMPNIFILATVGRDKATAYPTLYRHRTNGSKMSIVARASDTIQSIVDDYAVAIEGITVPPQFEFLKYLSRHYIDGIKKKLAEGSRNNHELTATPN